MMHRPGRPRDRVTGLWPLRQAMFPRTALLRRAGTYSP